MLTNNISFLTIIGAWYRLNYRASPIREFYCFMVTIMIFCRLQGFRNKDPLKIILMLCKNVALMQVYQLSTNFHAILKLKNLLSLIPDVSSLSQLQNLSRITLQKFPRFVHLSCELLRIAGHGRVYRLMHPSTRTGTEPASLDCLFFKQSQSPLLK